MLSSAYRWYLRNPGKYNAIFTFSLIGCVFSALFTNTSFVPTESDSACVSSPVGSDGNIKAPAPADKHLKDFYSDPTKQSLAAIDALKVQYKAATTSADKINIRQQINGETAKLMDTLPGDLRKMGFDVQVGTDSGLRDSPAAIKITGGSNALGIAIAMTMAAQGDSGALLISPATIESDFLATYDSKDDVKVGLFGDISGNDFDLLAQIVGHELTHDNDEDAAKAGLIPPLPNFSDETSFKRLGIGGYDPTQTSLDEVLAYTASAEMTQGAIDRGVAATDLRDAAADIGYQSAIFGAALLAQEKARPNSVPPQWISAANSAITKGQALMQTAGNLGLDQSGRGKSFANTLRSEFPNGRPQSSAAPILGRLPDAFRPENFGKDPFSNGTADQMLANSSDKFQTANDLVNYTLQQQNCSNGTCSISKDEYDRKYNDMMAQVLKTPYDPSGKSWAEKRDQNTCTPHPTPTPPPTPEPAPETGGGGGGEAQPEAQPDMCSTSMAFMDPNCFADYVVIVSPRRGTACIGDSSYENEDGTSYTVEGDCP
jgi:hypothetical protein